MSKKTRQPEHHKDRTEADDARPDAMERFNMLARRLAKVSREELQEQHERYGAEKMLRSRRKPAD